MSVNKSNKQMDQDQLTAAIVAGIVLLTSCVAITLSLFGCNRRRTNQYDESDLIHPNLIS